MGSELKVRLVPGNRLKASSKVFVLTGTCFVDHFCCLFLMFVICSRQFIAALWTPAGKGLTYWLLFVMSYCDLVTFPCCILG